MRCLIVHNPRSGFGSDAVFAFERELVAAGDECVLRVLGEECNNEEVLADAEGFDVVVLSGGDGTVSNLLYALRGRSVDTCVFPSGTANLLFANIGNSAEPAALARACRWGNVATCDLGEARWDHDGTSVTRGFSIMAGTGFDAELMTAAAPNKKAGRRRLPTSVALAILCFQEHPTAPSRSTARSTSATASPASWPTTP